MTNDEAAARLAAARLAAARLAAEKPAQVWELSEREKEIIKQLGGESTAADSI